MRLRVIAAVALAATFTLTPAAPADATRVQPCVSKYESKTLPWEPRRQVEAEWEVKGAGVRGVPPNWPTTPLEPLFGVDPQDPTLRIWSYRLCGHSDGWMTVYYKPGRRAVMFVTFIPPTSERRVSVPARELP